MALAVALFGAYYGTYEAMNYAATGDEPHYLLEARSLAFDGDRDMRNNYANPVEVKKVYGGSFDACCLQAYDYRGDGRPFPARAIVVADPGRARRLLGVAAVAFLPWLHVRYGLLAVALGLGLLWRARRDASPEARDRAMALAAAPTPSARSSEPTSAG